MIVERIGFTPESSNTKQLTKLQEYRLLLPLENQPAFDLVMKVFDGRKGKILGDPMVEHSLMVHNIVSRVSVDSEVRSAALLHDVVEDCNPYGSITVDTIAHYFGSRVATVVGELSEDKEIADWTERKYRTIHKIPTMSREALLIKTADEIQNMKRTMMGYREYNMQSKGDVFSLFNNTDKFARRKKIEDFLSAAENVWSENPLLVPAKQRLVHYISATES